MRPLAPLRRTATAARIAWRDLRKDPRQGTLVALLVALPATVLMTVSVVTESQQPTDGQRVTAQLGANEAWVQVVGPAGAHITQSAVDPQMMVIGDPPESSAQAPGDALALEDQAASRDLAPLLPAGTRTLTLARADAYVTSVRADVAGTFAALVGPAWDPAFAGLYDVVEGSAPGNNAVMVSSALAERWNLAVGDALTVGREGDERRVAGFIEVPHGVDDGIVFGSQEAMEPALAEDAPSARETTYLPDLELDWEAVQALNADGVAAYSRTVAEDPPAEYVAASDAQWQPAQDDVTAAILGVGLGLLEVILLAGAAFAVSMRRRQERLALLAATGAGRGTLVGVGLWNGALLGLAGGLIGVPVGLGVGAIWLAVIDRWGDAYTEVWGIHVAWLHVGGIVLFTTLSGAIAALVPAVASARRDVMAALRGSRKPVKPRRWPVVAGAVLVVAATAALVYAVHLRDVAWQTPEFESDAADARAARVTLAGVVLLFGAFIALTPMALRLAARVLGRVSLGARLASRDAARHAGRTVPVVAAIGVTVLLAGNVALNEVRMVEVYESYDHGQAQPGDAYVPLQTWQYDAPVVGDADALTARAEEEFPDIEALAIDQAQDSYDDTVVARVSIARLPADSLCPVWDPQTQTYDMSAMTKREIAQDPRCDERGGGEVYGLAVGGVAELEYIVGRTATASERDMLTSGGAVVFDPLMIGPDADGGTEGTVRIESWDAGGGGYIGEGEPAQVADIPAMVAVPDQWVALYYVILSPKAAATAGAEVVPGTLFLHRDAGFTELEADQLEAALMLEGEFHAYVQWPIDWGLAIITWGSLIATLLVAGAAAGLSLGLARADARRDDLTLTSLGASPRLARSMAAWQGAILVAFGVWSGMLCAAALDAIRAMERTVPGDFAWDVFTVGLIAPPLIVGAIAWLMTRASHAVHYRLAA